MPAFIRGFFKLSERLEDRIEGPLNEFLHMFGSLTTKAFVGYFEKHSNRQVELPEQWRDKENLNI